MRGSGIAVQSPLTGEITQGPQAAITIPQALRQPVPGVDASLTALNQTFNGKAGKNVPRPSTGCKDGKHSSAAS